MEDGETLLLFLLLVGQGWWRLGLIRGRTLKKEPPLLQRSRRKTHLGQSDTWVCVSGQRGGREVGVRRGLFKEMSIYKCKSSNYIPTHTPISG